MRSIQVLMFVVLVVANAHATITSQGDVTPDPTGGEVDGLLTVGEGQFSGITTIGRLSVEGSELTTDDSLVGDRLGSNGFVTVDGLTSIWLTDDDVEIGRAGNAELDVTNQAWVGNGDDFLIGSNTQGRGLVTVQDSGTILDIGDELVVGSQGFGTLLADERASIISDDAFVGRNANAVGNVELSGGASWRNRQDLTIGGSGHGTMSITEGALMENTNGTIGNVGSSSGLVTVNGSGTLWRNRANLTVGVAGRAELIIEDNGTVQAQSGVTVASKGYVELDNGRLIANQILNAGAISGDGTVIGTINNTEGGSIRTQSNGILSVRDVVSNAGTIDGVGGEAEFLSGVTNESTGFIGGHDVTLRFSGDLTNNGMLGFTTGVSDVFGEISNSGSIQVDGAGTVTFYDDFTNTSTGTIVVEPQAHAIFFGSVTMTAAGSLAVRGLASDPQPNGEPTINDPITGNAAFALAGDLSLTASDSPDEITDPTERGTTVTLRVLSGESITGVFDQVFYDNLELEVDFSDASGSFRGLDRASTEIGLFRELTYGSDDIEFTNYLALPGDANGDQSVSFSDFLVLSENFGAPGDWLDGDFDGDGQVAFADFLLLSNNFGATASAMAVPEPRGVTTFLLAWLLCVRRARRSKKSPAN